MKDQDVKALKIKTGVVKRLVREKQYYKDEAEQLRSKIDNMKSNGDDEYMVKKQLEVLQESLMMISDCHKRLVDATHDLQNYVTQQKELAETEDYNTALSVLESAQPELA